MTGSACSSQRTHRTLVGYNKENNENGVTLWVNGRVKKSKSYLESSSPGLYLLLSGSMSDYLEDAARWTTQFLSSTCEWSTAIHVPPRCTHMAESEAATWSSTETFRNRRKPPRVTTPWHRSLFNSLKWVPLKERNLSGWPLIYVEDGAIVYPLLRSTRWPPPIISSRTFTQKEKEMSWPFWPNKEMVRWLDLESQGCVNHPDLLQRPKKNELVAACWISVLDRASVVVTHPSLYSQVTIDQATADRQPGLTTGTAARRWPLIPQTSSEGTFRTTTGEGSPGHDIQEWRKRVGQIGNSLEFDFVVPPSGTALSRAKVMKSAWRAHSTTASCLSNSNVTERLVPAPFC